MYVGVVSIFPEIIKDYFAIGIMGRATREGLVDLNVFDVRDYANDVHKTVDDRPYGGGPGMVLMYEPLSLAVKAAKRKAPADTKVGLVSPQGEIFEQRTAIDKSQMDGIIVVCGRYEGFDERFIEEFVDFEWSVGDYIVSGGELPALTCLDAIIRNLPTVVNNAQSILDESFLDGTLDYPQYTRPELVDSLEVPSVLLSGNHSAVNSFRKAASLRKTYERRPDLLVGKTFSEDERKVLVDYFLAEDERRKR